VFRLLAVQGAWSYERMLGIGMGHAAQPLLAELRGREPVRHAEAMARAAEFFNANPNLAGVALGALARAELDLVPGRQIEKLRSALSSPLGSLGDQLFWAGLVPLLGAAAVTAAALGMDAGAALGIVIVYGVARWWVLRWGLRTGLASGMAIGQELTRSWIHRVIAPAGALAAFAVGLALPLAADWLPSGARGRDILATLLVAAVGTALSRWLSPTLTAVRFALMAAAVALLLRLVAA
ncbi:MAG: PTS system mannose/fructose/sorbose family transporter subunit IID, partial [Gemmatimonadota bacterium]|nr:PTS system mannose/fructose/sorbose family transporter subunit IID [Gemmatimonadota bacterium]